MKYIDPATGLRQLPEGYHWLVTKADQKFKGLDMFHVRIMETVETRTQKKGWFGKVTEVVDTKTNEIFKGPIWDRTLGVGVYACYLSEDLVKQATFETYDKFLKENREFTSAHRNEGKGAHLLGAYPPKTILKESNAD